MQRLNEISTELNQKIVEIQKLGGDITELQKAKDEIEKELKRTRRANGQVIKELKDRVEGYEELLKLKDEELIVNLQKELDVLKSQKIMDNGLNKKLQEEL